MLGQHKDRSHCSAVAKLDTVGQKRHFTAGAIREHSNLLALNWRVLSATSVDWPLNARFLRYQGRFCNQFHKNYTSFRRRLRLISCSITQSDHTASEPVSTAFHKVTRFEENGLFETTIRFTDVEVFSNSKPNTETSGFVPKSYNLIMKSGSGGWYVKNTKCNVMNETSFHDRKTVTA
jgi:hypothetical protein